jgi:hypothetical protein
MDNFPESKRELGLDYEPVREDWGPGPHEYHSLPSQPAPVQEPFGYLFQHEETGLTTVVDVQQVEWGFEKNNPRHQKIGPVYTTPPAAQRQWVGLTDEEIEKACVPLGAAMLSFTEVARAIEAKLKEKNT